MAAGLKHSSCRLSCAASRMLNNLHGNTVTIPAQQEDKRNSDNCDAGGENIFDCIVCLCEVAPAEEDGSKMLPNCDHGVQFHRGCIESWLKDHSTCPLCRSHVPRPVCHRLNTYLIKVRDDIVSYCNVALENVASSIGNCDDP